MAELAKKAKDNQGKRTDITSSNDFDNVDTHRQAATAADAFGTNQQYILDAQKLKTEAPDLLEQVATGEKSLPKALAILPI